ncbi:uncharacterized protein LOC135392365 [Ornithodoros turicata]|uniref:uncharacterized protein LOC135392365 n=1 Tax=Ornithodoros turicata TaxID=34597 RepID=UPI003139DEB2
MFPGDGSQASTPATAATAATSMVPSSPSISRVAVRLPSFITAHPDLWFKMADSQFALAGITQQATKFHLIVSNLPPEIAVEVTDILTAPPTPNVYDDLRKAVTERIMTSERERLRQQLAAEKLGDLRPSQLLRRMHCLLRSRLPTFDRPLLKERFLSRLPHQTQMVLAALADSSAEALAEVAGRVELSRVTIAHVPTTSLAFEVVPPSTSGHVPQATERPSYAVPPSPADPVSLLRSEVQELRQLIDHRLACSVSQPFSFAQPPGRQPRPRFRSPRPRNPRPSSPHTRRLSSPHASGPYCFYHYNFGASARKCTAPCQWPGNDMGRR